VDSLYSATAILTRNPDDFWNRDMGSEYGEEVDYEVPVNGKAVPVFEQKELFAGEVPF